jgi:hypothetical protein
MRPNTNLMKATLTGALGGLLFGFDTVVIAGAIRCAGRSLYGLSPQQKGFTVGYRTGGHRGRRAGRQEASGRGSAAARHLRVTAMLYVVSALGCGLAWSWPSFMVFRLIGGLGIGASSVLGPGLHCRTGSGQVARSTRRCIFQFNVVFGIHGGLHLELRHPAACNLGAAEWRWQVGIAANPRRRRSLRSSSSFPAARAGLPRATALTKHSQCSSSWAKKTPRPSLKTFVPRSSRSTPSPTSPSSAGSTATRFSLPSPSAHSTSSPESTPSSTTSTTSLPPPDSARFPATSRPSPSELHQLHVLHHRHVAH